MKKVYVVYFLWMILVSCEVNQQGKLPVIPVDLDNHRTISLSGITQDVKNIRLELTEQSLISDHVTRVIYTDDYIFLIDRKNPTPIMFDGNGKFLRTIGSMGQGPGEFTGMMTLQLIFKMNIYI